MRIYITIFEPILYKWFGLQLVPGFHINSGHTRYYYSSSLFVTTSQKYDSVLSFIASFCTFSTQ